MTDCSSFWADLFSASSVVISRRFLIPEVLHSSSWTPPCDFAINYSSRCFASCCDVFRTLFFEFSACFSNIAGFLSKYMCFREHQQNYASNCVCRALSFLLMASNVATCRPCFPCTAHLQGSTYGVLTDRSFSKDRAIYRHQLRVFFL